VFLSDKYISSNIKQLIKFIESEKKIWR
jgi:hypothetical protein